MILQSQIATVIDSQQKSFIKKELGIERDALNQLPLVDNFALIITGIRRCGKSTLLFQLLNQKFKDAIYLNFEDPRLAGFDLADFNRLSEEITNRDTKTLFFDEIQLIEKWELFIRQKLDEGYRIVITGSNAILLSKELGTKLTGRQLSVELFPFSYLEFLRFTNLENSNSSLDAYLKIGGIPEYVKTGLGIILNNLLEDILIRDIAIRYGIRDVSSLKQIAVYLISNIGKPVTAKSLLGLFDIKANSTILDYFSYLEDAYLLQFIPMFSYSLKSQMRNPRKVYIIDMGLFTENSIIFTEENGRRLENLVFLHLRRKYKEIYYFKNSGECDFVAMQQGQVKELIQVCYEVNDMNFKREYKGLTEAMDFFKQTEGTIVSFNQKDLFEEEGKIIRIIPAHEYLGTK